VDNARARRVAREHGKAVTGGSDAHSGEDLGWGFTSCGEGTVEGLLEAIRKGRTEAFIREETTAFRRW
jgi:histidinol phosphatase-like PHP family hydrolase